jgi:hypothetical protein
MIGQRLAQYLIVERIGAGGMGEVYRARDERLERDVAIKVEVLWRRLSRRLALSGAEGPKSRAQRGISC